MKRYAWMVLVLVSALGFAPRVQGQTVTGDVAKVTALFKAKDWKGVVAAADKAYADYGVEAIEASMPARSLYHHKAWGMFFSGDREGAVSFLKVRADDAASPSRLGACYELSRMFSGIGDKSSAHGYAVTFLGLWDGRGYGTQSANAFSYVKPALLGKDAYAALLESLILKIPAIEENAKFLGRLKSELEKIR